MKDAEKIERQLKMLRYEQSEESQQRVVGNLTDALERQRQNRSAETPAVWRIVMNSRITKLAAAAVVFIAAMVFWGNGQQVVLAELVESAREAKTLHYSVEVYGEQGWENYYEIWYSQDRGVVEMGHPLNRYDIRIDDGEQMWLYTPGNDFAIRAESMGTKEHVGIYTDGRWPQNKAIRDAAGDRAIDGVFCQMYVSQNREKTDMLQVWVEEINEQKFLRMWESYASDDQGNWEPSKRGRIEYNMLLEQAVFELDLEPNVRIIDAERIMGQDYGLDNAIFTQQEMGLIFAVHDLKLTEEGFIYIACTLRPTEETALKYRTFGRYYGNIELFSIINGAIVYPYCKVRLRDTGSYNGIQIKEWLLVPRDSWPENKDALDLGVRLYVEGELEEERKNAGLPDHEHFRPMASLVLPKEATQIDTVLSDVYSEAKTFDLIENTVLYLPYPDGKTELARDVNEEIFYDSVKAALNSMTTK